MSEPFDWDVILWDGEVVLWQGSPARDLYIFSWIDLYLALVIAGAIDQALSDHPFGQITLPTQIETFVSIMSVLLVSAFGGMRLVKDYALRSRQVYALTSRRALILDARRGCVERAVPLDPGLNSFDGGLAYRVLTFTQRRRMMWWIGRNLMLDGPPYRLGTNRARDVHVLAIQDRGRVTTIAEAQINRRRP